MIKITTPLPFATHGLVLLGLLIGTYTDFKWREMPDWVNFGMIFAGISINLLASLIYQNWWYVFNSIIGLIIFYGIAALMFYTGQWGGGDAKALMGMGALLGFDIRQVLQGKWPFMASFFVNALLIGAFYGLLWSIVLAIRYRKKFAEKWKWYWNKWKTQRYGIYAGTLLMLGGSFFVKALFVRFLFIFFALFALVLYLALLFIKSIEESCMFHQRTPEQLTEGDWITETITVKQLVVPYELLKEKYAPLLKREKMHDVLWHALGLLEELFPWKKINQWKTKRAQHFSFDHWFKEYCLKLAKKAQENPSVIAKLLQMNHKQWKQWKKHHPQSKVSKVFEEEEIFFDKAVIASPKDLGLELSQIAILRRLWKEGKITTIEVKEGIPFIPSFLVAYLLTIVWGNLFFLLL